MLTLSFFEYSFIFPFLVSYNFIWYIFYKFNFYSVRKKQLTNNKLNKTNIIKKLNFSIFAKIGLILSFYIILNIFNFKNYSNVFWWNHFFLSNFNNTIILVFFLLNSFFFLYVLFLSYYPLSYPNDYFFSILNLTLTLPLIFLSNNFFFFFFLLETISLLIFYKFVSTKIWYKKNTQQFENSNTNLQKILPKQYLNVLFFQFWATFFSTVFLIFFIMFALSLFGSTEWVYLNLLIYLELSTFYFNNNHLFSILGFLLLMGIFLKIGFTPFHLFKIEVYKGIPMLSIFFYTTYYFLIFFIFFSLLISNYLGSFFPFMWVFFSLILILGILYSISLLFDLNFLKAFFAYSTIINTLFFMLILMAINI